MLYWSLFWLPVSLEERKPEPNSTPLAAGIDKAMRARSESREPKTGSPRPTNLPVGLGETVFGSLDSELDRMALSIPAAKGVEFGSGFRSSKLTGSQNND